MLYESGLRVLTLTTTSAELLMQLVSTYTGDDRVARALVVEAIEWPHTDIPEFRHRELGVPSGFVTHRRECALADHIEAFCQLASSAHPETFEVADLVAIEGRSLVAHVAPPTPASAIHN